MSFWGSWCDHKQTSPPDEMGDVICADCGQLIRLVLTEANFLDTCDWIIRRTIAGTHRKACVHTTEGDWICATDCPVPRQGSSAA